MHFYWFATNTPPHPLHSLPPNILINLWIFNKCSMFIINDLSNETDRLIDRSSMIIIIIIIISGISRLAITIDRIHIHIQLNQLIDWHGIVGWDLWDTEHISSSSSIWIKYLNLKWTRRTKCHSGKDIFHSSAEFKIYRVYLVVSFCSIY